MRDITKIIIHCSATPDSSGLSWDDIERYHTSYAHNGRIIDTEQALRLIAEGERVKHPWQDIGYHAGIEYVDGHAVCLFGRPMQTPGAHCRGHNSDSIGFMFCGDFDHRQPDFELLAVAARRVLAPWCLTFGLTEAQLYPHRAFDDGKTCPGELFSMDPLRELVRSFIDD